MCEQVPCTTYVTECVIEKVPYTVCKKVPHTVVKKVPYTVCKMVQETVIKKVPCTITRNVTEVIHKQIPYTTEPLRPRCLCRYGQRRSCRGRRQRR